MGIIKRFFLRKKFKNNLYDNSINKTLDNYIADAIKSANDSSKLLDKIAKAKILNNLSIQNYNKSKQITEEEYNDDDDSEEDEEESDDDIVQNLVSQTIKKIASNSLGNGSVVGDSNTSLSPITSFLDNLSKEDIKKLKEKFLN